MAGSASINSRLPALPLSESTLAIIAVDAVFPVPPLPQTATIFFLPAVDSDIQISLFWLSLLMVFNQPMPPWLEVPRMRGFPEPAGDIEHKSKYRKFHTDDDELFCILKRKCTPDFPLDRFSGVHKKNKMVPQGFTILNFGD
jgi:hypothetical protein